MKRLLKFLMRIFCVTHVMRYLNRNKVTILMLHGVAGEHKDAAWRPLWARLNTEVLDQNLQEFAKYYNFVSLPDAVDMVEGIRPWVKNPMVLTFDDGYRNNLTEALPILRKHGAQASLFVATGFIESGRSYWIDRLDFALQAAPEDARLIDAGFAQFDLRNMGRKELQQGYTRLRLAIKANSATDDEMYARLDAISEALEVAAGRSIDDVIYSDPFVSVATWDELAAAMAPDVEIGSHTVDHLRLIAVDNDSSKQQLEQSRTQIQERLQNDCAYFCYPNGDVNDEVARQTKDVGYRAAVTTESGLNAAGCDLHRMKRYAMPTTNDQFKNLLAISGLFELPVLRHIAGKLS